MNSLKEIVSLKGPLPAKDAATLCLKIIDYARSFSTGTMSAYMRLDLHPSSIFLRDDETIFIPTKYAWMDEFGPPSFCNLDRSLDPISVCDYVPPELLVDRPPVAAESSYIWAIGAMLHFMLTGTPPYHPGTLSERIMAALRSAPTYEDVGSDDIRRALQAVCRSSVCPGIDSRYPSLASFAHAVEDSLRTCQ